MFSAFEDDAPMWSGNGPRHIRKQIIFDKPFFTAPVVQVSISMWDIDGGSNQRADLQAENVTASGFTLVFRTWGDTRVARIRADWLAIGPVPHADDFTL
ncbi:H-type lectin domain-containing protein [Paracoccus amoyensis]|nr:H-type lectin domain-containing protein [Paracoccus amoyensis]